MAQQKRSIGQTAVTHVVNALFSVPWLEMVADLWRASRKLWHGLAHEGMYEVLEHEATLELKDTKGKRALIRKQQKVKYLQNNIVSYQDQAWGNGQILLKYKCSPGVEADRYESGHKTRILISLREVKERNEADDFNIQWEQRNGYTRVIEEWGSEINHKTKRFKLKVIFPKTRPPQKVFLVENLTRKTKLLPPENIRKLPNGRYAATWQTNKPRLYEQYRLKWEW